MNNYKYSKSIYFAFGITIFLWASAFPVIKIALTDFKAEHLSALRLLIAAILLCIKNTTFSNKRHTFYFIIRLLRFYSLSHCIKYWRVLCKCWCSKFNCFNNIHFFGITCHLLFKRKVFKVSLVRINYCISRCGLNLTR